MRLFSHPMSSNARRVRLAAHELGLALDEVLVDLVKGEQRQPAFLQKNPNGAVPVLEDDGFVLTESHAIMQYLADKVAGQTLSPSDPRGRADVSRWLFWNAHHFQPAISVLVWERMIKGYLGLGPASPSEEARGTELCGRYGKVLDEHLRGKTWIAQDRLTLADLAIAPALAAMVPARLPLAELPSLSAWLRRVQERPSWRETEPKAP